MVYLDIFRLLLLYAKIVEKSTEFMRNFFACQVKRDALPFFLFYVAAFLVAPVQTDKKTRNKVKVKTRAAKVNSK